MFCFLLQMFQFQLQLSLANNCLVKRVIIHEQTLGNKSWESFLLYFTHLKLLYSVKLCSGYFIKKRKTDIFINSNLLFLICCYIPFCRCFSFIGRIRGSQELSLANNCLVERVIIHEFVHALGFFHEQSRPDRDNFIQVFLDRVQSGKLASLSLLLLRFKTVLTFSWQSPWRSSAVIDPLDQRVTLTLRKTFIWRLKRHINFLCRFRLACLSTEELTTFQLKS